MQNQSRNIDPFGNDIRLKNHEKLNSILNIFKGVEEYVLDTNGVIISSNLEAVTITGYEEWEVIGQHFSIFYSIDDQVRRLYLDELSKAKSLGVYLTSGLRVKKRNSPFWAKIKIEALNNSHSVLAGFRLTIQDATHKAIHSHNLNLIKDEYLNLFNNPFIGIFKFRISDFKVLMVNEKCKSILGNDCSKLYLDTVFIDTVKFNIIVNDLIEHRRVENRELELFSPKTGKRVWVSLSCKYFSSVGFVEGVMLDVTDKHKQIERTLSLSNELESFIYHASHDLRSPITSLYGLVNLLKRDGNELTKVNEFAKLIEGRVRTLDNILKDIVEIAFNTAVPISPERINVNQELYSIIEHYSNNYPDIKTTIESNEEIELETDVVRFASVMRHLISNSFKYANPTIQSKYIEIIVRQDSEHVFIKVLDNGIGISKDSIDKVFTLFYKATESYKGNGLGLFIVKSMMEKICGEVELQSQLGIGTEVTLKFPKKINSHI